MADVITGRKKHLRPVKRIISVTDTPFICAEAASLGRDLRSLHVAAAFGDDVHHSEEGIGPVERRSRTANYLDALYQADVEHEFRAEHGTVVDVVIDAMAVDEEQHFGAVVARVGKPADSEVGVITVVIHKQARN